jgi:L-fuconolactonase
MRIDAHQHFWRLDRGDYGWLTPELAAIHRDFLPDDLAPIIARHGIDRTILVQAAPTIAESAFLLALAARTPFIAGVVGWVDFTAPDAAETIARMAADPLLVGLRPMVHDIADPTWLQRMDLVPAIQAMVGHHLVFDALVRPQHLGALRRFIDRFPDLQVVVDHGGKPEIRQRVEASWRADLRAIAANERVVCKLSGLITEAATDWRPDQVLPYCDRLLQMFGPQRLLWGSDWPVVNLAGGYDVWRALAGEALQDLSAADRAAVLGGNAARVYLGRGRGRPAAAV